MYKSTIMSVGSETVCGTMGLYMYYGFSLSTDNLKKSVYL